MRATAWTRIEPWITVQELPRHLAGTVLGFIGILLIPVAFLGAVWLGH